MAEGIAFDLVTGVVGKLGSTLWDEIGLLRSFKDDADDLRSNFSAIQAVLLDAEERSRVEIEETHALRIWLGKLKDAAYDADDLLDVIRTEALLRKQQHRFLTHANPMHLKFKLKMAHRMKELRKEIDKIAKQRHDFGLVQAGPRPQAESNPRETFSVVDEKKIVGRDDDKEKIVKLLLETGGDHDVSVIPIVGLGGLGKTTLAQLAFNDVRVEGEQRFDLRVWVCVSTDFDMKTIARSIISATGEKCDNLDNLESIVRRIVGIFSKKRFLLVLDDVWNEDQGKWEELKVLFKDGMKGSKILVTTRSEKVVEIMKTIEQPHRLKGLSDDYCWTLFKRRAFKEGEENDYPNLVTIGKQIVKKCGGVPLAAQALGGLMRFKSRTEDAWSAFRDSKLWRLEEEKEILPSLKLSYIQMPSALKRCFVYCSIFPKDYEIDKDDLIQQWIALGFISSPDTSTLMEDIGNDYFNNLLWMSFLQETYRGGDTCQMHDLVHDLAQSVASKEVAVIVGEEPTRILEGCRYASICDRSMPQVPTAVVRRLRALRFRESASLTTFYSEAKCLRLLDLHNSGISMLPSSIGKLKLLRYLNLSGTNIQELPESITGLCNLQNLNLSLCNRISTLPKSLGSLVNLQILDLSECDSLTLLDSISNLQNLYKLNLKFCTELRSVEPICHLKNLRDLNLSGLINLQTLPEFIGNLKNLTIKDCEDLERIEDWLGELTKLKYLKIHRCSSLRYLPFHKMTTLSWLSIKDCPLLFNAGGDLRVNERPEPCLPTSVQELVISRMSKEFLSLILKRPTMDSETPPGDGDAVSLQQPNMVLRNLEIVNCQQLTCLPEGLRSFMSLEHLTIWDCGDLERIEDWLGELTKLKDLDIRWCSSLRYLPAHKMTSLKRLFIYDCPLLFNADGQFVDTNVDHIRDVEVDRREYKHKKRVSNS